MSFLEIACFNSESALVAQAAGADRIEFCAEMSAGGVTPSLSSLREIRDRITIPIYVMIRPRGGDFVYTEREFEIMKLDVMRFKDVVNGFVFGILDHDGNVDVRRNCELTQLAHPLPCTFHRAFDATANPGLALSDVIECEFQSILTSGCEANAVAGSDMLSNLVQGSKGLIEIMPGGGVRSSNIGTLKSCTGAKWYHSSAVTGQGEAADEVEIANLKAQLA